MKKLTLLVYPEFSLQEVINLSRLFRWDFDICTEVISSSRNPIKSEEGIMVLPQKSVGDISGDCLSEDRSQLYCRYLFFVF